MAIEWATGARYHGVEIKDVDPTVKCRHAKHGYKSDKLAILSDASLLMLADSVLLVVCNECGYNGITAYKPYVTPEGAVDGTYKPIIKQADSLLAHINGKHRRGTGLKAARNARLAAAGVSREEISRAAVRRVLATAKAKAEHRPNSRYTTEQIKVFIKIWLKWQKTGLKTWTQAACNEIEGLGFETQFGNGWNPDQLGSLVRSYMHKPEFRNVKAGPMDEDDKATLEAMVRESAGRVGRTGNHVADNARITVKPRKPAWHENLPTHTHDEPAQEEQQEEEDAMAASSKGPLPAPTLSFADPAAGAMEPVKVLTVPTVSSVSIPAQRSPAPAAVPVQVPVQSDFALVSVMDDGSVIFTYKGVLMGAKPIKGFQL